MPARKRVALVAAEAALDRASDAAVRAWDAGTCWRERVRGSVAAILALAEAHPDAARGTLAALDHPALGRRRAELEARLLRAIRQGAEDPDAVDAQPQSAPWVLHTALAVLRARLAAEPAPELTDLTETLTALVCLPSLSPATVLATLARPAAPGPA